MYKNVKDILVVDIRCIC